MSFKVFYESNVSRKKYKHLKLICNDNKTIEVDLTKQKSFIRWRMPKDTVIWKVRLPFDCQVDLTTAYKKRRKNMLISNLYRERKLAEMDNYDFQFDALQRKLIERAIGNERFNNTMETSPWDAADSCQTLEMIDDTEEPFDMKDEFTFESNLTLVDTSWETTGSDILTVSSKPPKPATVKYSKSCVPKRVGSHTLSCRNSGLRKYVSTDMVGDTGKNDDIKVLYRSNTFAI